MHGLSIGPGRGGGPVVREAGKAGHLGKGPSRIAARLNGEGDTLVNTGVARPIDSTEAWAQVLRMQAKLHRWAVADLGRRFDDVFNLVYDPAFLAAAWDRVRTNTGARTAGVDQITPRSITSARATAMLADLRDQVKTGRFVPDRVR